MVVRGALGKRILAKGDVIRKTYEGGTPYPWKQIYLEVASKWRIMEVRGKSTSITGKWSQMLRKEIWFTPLNN